MNTALVIAARKRHGLTQIEHHVLLMLATHDQGYHPTVHQLADEGAMCVRSVQRVLGKLVEMKLARSVTSIKGGRNQIARYAIAPIIAINGGSETATESRGFDPETATVSPENRDCESHLKNKEKIKEEAADARAPLPAYALVWQAFNDARAMVLGEEFRLPCPAGSDRGHAEQFLAQGVTVQECAAIFVEKIERANRAKPPGTLAYFQKPIAEFVADRKAPSKDRRHDQQYHSAPGKSGRGGGVVSSETWRGCLADFVLEQSGLDDRRTAAGGLP